MAIFQDYSECTAELLAQGADLLVKDDEARTPLHLAAEIGAQHVEAILKHCRNNARYLSEIKGYIPRLSEAGGGDRRPARRGYTGALQK